MMEVFKNEGNGYMYFEWGNPENNFGGLLFTPFVQRAVRKKNYFTFKQFVNGAAKGNRTFIKVGGINKFSKDNVISFTVGRTTYVHVNNWNGSAENNLRINIGKKIKNVVVYRTSAREGNKEIFKRYGYNKIGFVTNFASKSTTTIRMTW